VRSIIGEMMEVIHMATVLIYAVWYTDHTRPPLKPAHTTEKQSIMGKNTNAKNVLCPSH